MSVMARRGSAALAVAATLLLAGCVTASPAASQASLPASIAASASASPVVSTSPSILTSDIYTTWERITLPDPAPDVYGGGLPWDVVAFGDRYVAVGFINADCCDGGDPFVDSGVMWISDDGRDWQLFADVATFQHAGLFHLVTDGSQLLAVGWFAASAPNGEAVRTPAIWRSTDALTWTRSEGSVPSLVARGGPGFVGYIPTDEGVGAGSRQGTFTQSSDGITWKVASAPISGVVEALLGTPTGGAIAVGAVDGPPRADGGPTFDGVIWRSTDGMSWTGPERIATEAHLQAVARGGPGFVATGIKDEQLANGSTDSFAAVWSSPDGLEWRRASNARIQDYSFKTIVNVDGVLIAVGESVWTSSDGSTWAMATNALGLRGEIARLVATPDGILAVGSGGNDVGHVSPFAWLARR